MFKNSDLYAIVDFIPMPENKVYTAIGLMSGTSLDGIDVALARTDGQAYCEMVESLFYAYTDQQRAHIRAAFGHRQPSAVTEQAAKALTEAHIAALQDFNQPADIIGFHGQTIRHDPADRFTWQIGDAALLARSVNIEVTGDMRQADIKAGGQGAPLLPVCHRAFAGKIDKPVAVLNLGGVGNITWLGSAHEEIMAFDTGPANALMDDFMLTRTGERYDRDGLYAGRGKADKALVEQWLSHPYFQTKPPKSLDRDEWTIEPLAEHSLEEGLATLLEFTTQSVCKAFDHLPETPTALYVAGGGRHNLALMQRLGICAPCPVRPVEAIGWNGDMLEALGFAYLAVRSLKGLPLTFPETTGVNKPVSGGVLYKCNEAAQKASNL
jgi:anhydro-N-acetylmuramic acid kinase